MNSPKQKSPQYAMAWIAALMIALAVVAVGFLIAAAPNSASAAAPAIAPQAPGLAPAINPMAAPLQQTQVFTDIYDTNAAAPNYNDFFGSASQIGLASCSVAQPVTLLTIYRANAITPASDVDYYYVNASPQRVLTVTVAIDGPNSDLGAAVQVIDANQLILSQGTANFNAPISLNAYSLSGGRFSVRVESNNKSLTGTEAKPYSLLICQSDVNVAPTTAPSATPTATGTPLGAAPDNREPNDSPYIAFEQNRNNTFVNIGSQLTNLNFYTNTIIGVREMGDVDWYWFYSQKGKRIRITTSVQPGVDTELFLFNGCCNDSLPPNESDLQDLNRSSKGQIAYSDDYQPLDRGSQIIFDTTYEGNYWLKVWNKDQSPRVAGQTYNVTVVEIPPGTVVPTLPATAYPAGADRFEYNGDFNSATLIAPGAKVDQLNFVPFQPTNPDTQDNDFYRLPVKQGLYYTCETLDLSAGTDTNIIVYAGSDFNSALGGNDDISPEERERGNFRSRFSWLASYSGYAYILVGQVLPQRANEGTSRTYSILCNIGLPPSPTPTVNPNPPTATPPPPPPTAVVPPTPEPTARQPINLIVQPVDQNQLQPTAAPTPTPRILVIEVQTFNDYNRNGQLDPGSNEGIAGTSVRLYDAQTSTPLGQAFTDGDGKVRFSINNEGPVQVSVPVFGYLTVVDTSPATIRIGLQPSVPAPERLP